MKNISLRAATLGLSLAAILGAGMLQPVQAQDWRDIARGVVGGPQNNNQHINGYENNDSLKMIDHRADGLANRLHVAANTGQISDRQFDALNSQVQDVLINVRRMRQTGNISFQQQNYLNRRLSDVEQRLRFATASRTGRQWY